MVRMAYYVFGFMIVVAIILVVYSILTIMFRVLKVVRVPKGYVIENYGNK